MSENTTLLGEYCKLRPEDRGARIDPRDVLFDILQDALDAVAGKTGAALVEFRKNPDQIGALAGVMYLGAQIEHAGKRIEEALRDVAEAVESSRKPDDCFCSSDGQ